MQKLPHAYANYLLLYPNDVLSFEELVNLITSGKFGEALDFAVQNNLEFSKVFIECSRGRISLSSFVNRSEVLLSHLVDHTLSLLPHKRSIVERAIIINLRDSFMFDEQSLAMLAQLGHTFMLSIHKTSWVISSSHGKVVIFNPVYGEKLLSAERIQEINSVSARSSIEEKVAKILIVPCSLLNGQRARKSIESVLLEMFPQLDIEQSLASANTNQLEEFIKIMSADHGQEVDIKLLENILIDCITNQQYEAVLKFLGSLSPRLQLSEQMDRMLQNLLLWALRSENFQLTTLIFMKINFLKIHTIAKILDFTKNNSPEVLVFFLKLMTNRQLHDLSNHSSLFKTVLSACSASMDPELAVKLIMAGMTSQKQFIPAGTIEAIKQLNLSSNRFFKLCIVLVKDKGYWQHGTYIFKNLHLNTLSTHQKTELLSLAFAHLNIEIINKLMTNFDKDLSSFFVEKIKRYFTDKTPSISVKLSVIKAIISLDDAIPTHFTALLSKLIEYISKDRFGKTQFLKLIESIPNEPCSKIKLHNNEILSRFDGSEKEILAKICSIQTPRELSISRQKKQPL